MHCRNIDLGNAPQVAIGDRWQITLIYAKFTQQNEKGIYPFVTLDQLRPGASRTRSTGVLDVTFREDDSRIRKDHGPANFALLRRIAINVAR